MKRFLLSLVALVGAWLWSRGARDPRQWPKRLPEEIAALWDDLDDAFAAGRRASVDQRHAFDEDLRRAQSRVHDR